MKSFFFLVTIQINVHNDLNVFFFFRTDVAEFFQPSIDCIVKAVLEQKKSAHKTISVSFFFFLLVIV